MKKLLLCTLLFPLVLASCKKDDHEPAFIFPEGKVPEKIIELTGEEGLLPSRITRTESSSNSVATTITTLILEYGYDDRNRIVSIDERKEVKRILAEDQSEKINVMETGRDVLTYHDRGYLLNRVSWYNGFLVETVYYAYEGDAVFRKTTAEKTTYVSRITLDEAGRALACTHADLSPDRYYAKYQYDGDGNVIYHEDVIGGNSGTWLTIGYDDKKGIFSSVNTPQWYMATQTDFIFGDAFGNSCFPFLQNNKREQEDRFRPEYKYSLAFEYNEQGYPVLFYHPEPGYYHGDETYTVEYVPAKVF